ncbi:polysaccharide biosynthesis/export family protein [Hansschlegelia plantiphila]|uniref:polysaccharide biosynthesis/export family protein n=1 Tax=Hansschlegelia plantiphila TaxID=374655 RepID=UPI0022F27025|nr:polysaccharide biosynthesis/export family protein [Hansschlegelia plantiphila]
MSAVSGGVTGDATLQVVQSLPPPANTNNGADQLISPSDVLDVGVFQVSDLNRTVQVDSAGNVSLPLVGTQKAAGLTVRALEASLEREYGSKYLQNPDVTVFMKESAGQKVTVDGEVNRAGIYPIPANTTLLQIVALAGGFRPVADVSKVYVFRQVGPKQLVANMNVEAVRNGAQPDPKIYGGDKVVVFSSSSKVAFQNLKESLGMVANAGRFVPVPY